MFVFLFLILFSLVSVVAPSYADYLENNLDSIKRDESVYVKDELGRLAEWKYRDLEEIEKYIQGINPELVEGSKNMSDVEKSAEYKSWLAQKAYQDFFEKYLQDLKSYSERLGRKIKSAKSGKRARNISLKKFDKKIVDFADDTDGIAGVFSLSTDDLKDCHRNPVNREKICYEPDGYIRYQIDYKESNDGAKSFTVSKDVPEENRSSYYHFQLNYNNQRITTTDGGERLLKNYDFGFTAIDQEYDKMLKYRNYLVHDLLNDMCRVVCKKCHINGKKSTLIECDTDMEKYKSNIIPGFIGINFVEHYNLDAESEEQYDEIY